MSEDLRAMVQTIKASGATSLGAIAKALQDRGIKTPAGATTWHRAQVARLLGAKVVPAEVTPALGTLATVATVEAVQVDSDQDQAGSSPAPPLVHVVITANHVPLPVEPDGTVRPGWATAERTEQVNRGRRLCVPTDLAELLAFRRQAASLPGSIV